MSTNIAATSRLQDETTEVESYQFQSLLSTSDEEAYDQIRLFRLSQQPDKQSGLISGHLETVSLADFPWYSALSYEWGPSEPTYPILIDGKPHRIRENLYKFLINYASLPPSILPIEPLWIDQISVDQSNIPERNQQVRLMADIFSSANKVIAWFGIDEDIADFLDTEVARLEKPDQERNFDERYWTKGMRKFLEASYWKRLWIQQEVYFGGEVFFMACQSVLACSELMGRKANYVRQPQALLLRLQDYKTYVPLEHDTYFPLSSAIIRFSYNSCADPRDKVFGILAMVRGQDRIEVNYDLSTREVFFAALDMGLKSSKPDVVESYGTIRVEEVFLRLASYMGLGKGKSIYVLFDEAGEDVTRLILNYCRRFKGQPDLTDTELDYYRLEWSSDED
jgi:hypothetical protein